MRPPALRPSCGAALAVILLSACGGGRAPATGDASTATPPPAPPVAVTLPPDPLVALVPRPSDVAASLLPVVTGSGPRDLAAVAGFSANPAPAAAALRAHGFTGAYVAQYAEQPRAGGVGQVLSVVVSGFATGAGAAADLAGDVAASGTGEAAAVGTGGRLQVQPLPGGKGQLTTLRFRVGTHTWLLALGAPAADRADVLTLGRLLAGRADPA